MTAVLQVLFDALSLGSLYALGALGIALIFGVMRLFNFAHGDYMALGAFTAFVFNIALGQHLLVSALAGDQMVVAKGARSFRQELETPIGLTFDTSRCYLFDAASGARI